MAAAFTLRRRPRTRIRGLLRPDMAPLVAVAFLLLIFFVFRQMNDPLRIIEQTAPPRGDSDIGCGIFIDEDERDQHKIACFYLIDNQVYRFWFGDWAGEEVLPRIDSFPYDQLRVQLLAHLDRYPNRCSLGMRFEEIKVSRCWDPVVVVKPLPGCRYGQFVGCLSLLTSLDAKYAIDEIHPFDQAILPNATVYE